MAQTLNITTKTGQTLKTELTDKVMPKTGAVELRPVNRKTVRLNTAEALAMFDGATITDSNGTTAEDIAEILAEIGIDRDPDAVDGIMRTKTEADGNERGRKPEWFAARVTGRFDIVRDGWIWRITVEIKAESSNPETSLLSITGKRRSFGTGGGGRTQTAVTSMEALFVTLDEI